MTENFQQSEDESREYNRDCAEKLTPGSEESNDGETNDRDDEKNIQDLMQTELTRQFRQQDFSLKQEIPLSLQGTANEVSPSTAATNISSTASLGNQENRQRTFLVAQLVDSNDGNRENNFQLQQQRAYYNEQFKTSYRANEHDSLLTKLMLDHEQQREQSAELRFDMNSIDESGQQRAEPLDQINNQQQQHKDGGGHRSQLTIGGTTATDDQLKARNIDLDEHVKLVDLFGIQIVALTINGKERLCLAQISNTLLKEFSYNEIHNRRVALGITCVQCTPIQLEMLRRAGAMPSSSRRCGMITMREAERLCKSFLAEEQPPELPENFYFTVAHRVNYGCRGRFVPARYISSRAKCIECFTCGDFFSPNKFIFHSHKDSEATDCNPPDSPNINSWRKHINLDWSHEHSQEIKYAWEDVKSLFNGGTRRRTTFGGNFGPAVSDRLSSCSSDHHPAQDTTLAEAISHQKTTNDQRTGKSSCGRGSSLSGGRKHGQQLALQQRQRSQLMASEETDIDVLIRDTRRPEQQRSTPAPPLSQNERRKIPIGAWPRERQKHQIAGDLQPGQSVSGIRRSSSHTHDKIAHQQHQIKRFATQDNWQQQPKLTLSGKTAGALHMSLASDQQQHQNSLHQFNGPFHPDSMSNQHQVAASRLVNANQSNTDMSGLAGTRNMNSIGASNCLVPGDAMAQSDKSQSRAAGQSISSSGNFIYGQLYSQLMQTHLAQQVDQRRRQQQLQQQQMAPFDAQIALRQHIWSSLLANLRSNQTQLEQQPASQQGFKSNQIPDYCLTNSVGHQQQTNSLLAAAAAAACASASTTTNNTNSSFLHHNSTAKQQCGIKEPNELAGLSLQAPNLMHMYATGAQVNVNDVAAMFNGTNETC